MPNKIYSFPSTFSINEEISNKDTRFLKISIDLMHVGLNLNNSFFDKDVVNACIDSVKNTPILGFVKYDEYTDETDFAGHEYVLRRTENGVEEFYAGRAYGVIPESCNPRWIVKVCDDGIEREFLQVDALMWEKFDDATSILYRDSEKSESMELEVSSVEGYEDENGIFHFKKFRFDGACILGNQCVPAMTGANVKIIDGFNFSISDIVESVRSELNDKFELFSATFAAFVNDGSNQGGAWNMFDTENMEQVVDDQTVDFEHEDVETVAVEAEASECENCAVAEFETESAETETEIADVNVDYEKVKADYEELSFAFNQLKEEYETIKAEYETIKPKYDEYVRAEEQRAIDEMNAQKDAKFAEYEDVLSESAEFAALKEKKDEMSVNDIERECAVMFVKATRAKMNFSKSTSNSAVLNVVNDDGEFEEVDGYVNTKYGLVKRGR